MTTFVLRDELASRDIARIGLNHNHEVFYRQLFARGIKSLHGLHSRDVVQQISSVIDLVAPDDIHSIKYTLRQILQIAKTNSGFWHVE